MLVTQLEGQVSAENWDTLKQAFRASLEHLPSAIFRSYLVQDTSARDTWRVITVWHSRPALAAYRASVETPEGVLMFRAAGTEPTLTIGAVVEHTP